MLCPYQESVTKTVQHSLHLLRIPQYKQALQPFLLAQYLPKMLFRMNVFVKPSEALEQTLDRKEEPNPSSPKNPPGVALVPTKMHISGCLFYFAWNAVLLNSFYAQAISWRRRAAMCLYKCIEAERPLAV